jgi:hypothetical protein
MVFNTSTSYFHKESFHYFKDYFNDETNPRAIITRVYNHPKPPKLIKRSHPQETRPKQKDVLEATANSQELCIFSKNCWAIP